MADTLPADDRGLGTVGRLPPRHARQTGEVEWKRITCLSTPPLPSHPMNRQAWTRDQLIKVLSLYCRLPFGKMHARNTAVIELAGAIERTPSAVALKLVNLASLDPELRRRGVGGMGNSSVADRAIWEEFYGNWDVLAENTLEVSAVEQAIQPSSKRVIPRTAPSGPTEVVVEATLRRGQTFFRAAVLAAHDSKCCVTGIASESLLRASHIVPWSHNPAYRLDPRNGLCLNALHDAAFDRGLISLTEKYELLVSKRLKDTVPAPIYVEMFDRRAGSPITLPERFKPSVKMLDYHRQAIFLG